MLQRMPCIPGALNATGDTQTLQDPWQKPPQVVNPNSADLPVAADGICAASGVVGVCGQQPVTWEPMARPGGSVLGGSVPSAPREGLGGAGQRCAPQHHRRCHGNCRMSHTGF